MAEVIVGKDGPPRSDGASSMRPAPNGPAKTQNRPEAASGLDQQVVTISRHQTGERLIPGVVQVSLIRFIGAFWSEAGSVRGAG